MTAPLLSVRDLHVTFSVRHGDLKALDGISFDVERGEILGFVGESGAGKSMMGAAVIGLIEPPGRISRGEIWLSGERIDMVPETVRGNRIGMIFQDPLTSLDPLQTIGDQLVETILAHRPMDIKDARNRAAQGLEEVDIDPTRLIAYPHEFSGGMRQRVVIALALAAEPELIIADEPTTALDVSVQAQVLDLLRRVCKERGAGVILITHDMGVISETTDRVAVLYSGRLTEIGKTSEVLSNSKHPYTKGLIAATPSVEDGSVDSVLFQIPGSMPRLDAVPDGCAFHPRCQVKEPRCATKRPDFPADRVACWLYEKEGRV